MSNDGAAHRYRVNFEVEGLEDPELLAVEEMRGRDELSRLFEFELIVSHRDGLSFDEEDFERIFGSGAVVSWGPEREHGMKGVVRAVELLPRADPSDIAYRMRFVPKLWDSTLTRGSWVFLDKALADLIPAAFDSDVLAEGEDYELQLDDTWYPPSEYVLQYEESDFDFVCRKIEHFGAFFFFDHVGEKAKAIFADNNRAFTQLEGFDTIEFAPVTGGVDEAECIFELGMTRVFGPKTMTIREYNDRIPSVDLTQTLEIDELGVGTQHEWGNHHLTPDEGAAIVERRAQEINAKRLRFGARSRVRGLRPGHRFGLVNHPLGLDRHFVVVAVEHRYRASAEMAGGEYENRLVLQPLEVPYRPPRITPRPTIAGVIPAKIDSEKADDGVHTPIDEWGRYKVLLPFRVNGEAGGRASCWVRMASSAAGAGYGMHVPLHEGVEVALFHINGDPDRPIIAGAVPNTETASPVNDTNANQSQIRTRGGIFLNFSD